MSGAKNPLCGPTDIILLKGYKIMYNTESNFNKGISLLDFNISWNDDLWSTPEEELTVKQRAMREYSDDIIVKELYDIREEDVAKTIRTIKYA